MKTNNINLAFGENVGVIQKSGGVQFTIYGILKKRKNHGFLQVGGETLSAGVLFKEENILRIENNGHLIYL